jgi:SAM-dependent methyltransferase
VTDGTRGYVFDNAAANERARLDAVEGFLDPGSIRHLQMLGIAPGMRCLEVGAGGGSIARWIAEAVGPRGHVVATDVETRLLEPLASEVLEIRRHDVAVDPLEPHAYDLIHARLVLEHVPGRSAALASLVSALAPGGALLLEGVDYAAGIPIGTRGAQEHAHVQAVRLRAFSAAGHDPYGGRHLPRQLRDAGLVDVGNEGRVVVMEPGAPATRWFALSLAHLRGRLTGPDLLSAEEIDAMLGFFEDPDWAALSPIIFAAWGRKAPG